MSIFEDAFQKGKNLKQGFKAQTEYVPPPKTEIEIIHELIFSKFDNFALDPITITQGRWVPKHKNLWGEIWNKKVPTPERYEGEISPILKNTWQGLDITAYYSDYYIFSIFDGSTTTSRPDIRTIQSTDRLIQLSGRLGDYNLEINKTPFGKKPRIRTCITGDHDSNISYKLGEIKTQSYRGKDLSEAISRFASVLGELAPNKEKEISEIFDMVTYDLQSKNYLREYDYRDREYDQRSLDQ